MLARLFRRTWGASGYEQAGLRVSHAYLERRTCNGSEVACGSSREDFRNEARQAGSPQRALCHFSWKSGREKRSGSVILGQTARLASTFVFYAVSSLHDRCVGTPFPRQKLNH